MREHLGEAYPEKEAPEIVVPAVRLSVLKLAWSTIWKFFFVEWQLDSRT